MSRTSESAPSAHTPKSTLTQIGTFDPADWLARYTALGGVYVANGKLNLCVLVNEQTEEELSRIRQMIVDLTDDDKAAILAHLNAAEAAQPMGWEELIAKYLADRAAWDAHPYSRAATDDPAYERLSEEDSALMRVSLASLRKVIAAPAPDYAAVLRKIAIASYEYGDTGGVFGALMADMERLAEKRDEGADSEIFAAWERRRIAFSQYNALPFSEKDDEDYTPEELACRNIIDAAEEVIQRSVATTPNGVAIQLWAALRYCVMTRGHEEAVHRQDLEALESDAEELEGQGPWVIAALRSLKSMEA